MGGGIGLSGQIWMYHCGDEGGLGEELCHMPVNDEVEHVDLVLGVLGCGL